MILLYVLAQATAAAVSPADPSSAAAAQPAVTSYPPAFFAAQNPSSALDMLARIPGFSLDNGSNVRGFEGAAGNALIDGQRPSSKSDSIDQVLQRIPAGKVERIDIIRGGAPGIDMQGKTVIANVIVKRGGGVRALLAVSNQTLTNGRDFAGVRAEASGALDERIWEISARIGGGPDDGASSGGRGAVVFADGRAPQISRLDSEGFALNGSIAAAGETPLAGGRLRLNGRFFQEKYKNAETDTILSPAPEVQRFSFAQRTTDTELGGRFTRDLGPATSLEMVALRTTRRRSPESLSDVSGSKSDFLNHRESSEEILRGVIKRRFGDKISVEVGAEGADNKLDSHTTFTVDGARRTVPAANVRVVERRSEVFAKGTWRPSAQWTVDAAFRFESSDIASAGDVVLAKTLAFAKPRLTVSWTPAPTTQLRVRVEREVGQLDFNDFVASSNLTTSLGVTAGNPDLNPEQDWVGEVAVEQQLWKGASFVLTARHFNITNVVDRGPVFAADGTLFDRPTNIGDGKRDALILDYTLPFDALGWKGALLKGQFVRRWTEVTDPTTHETRDISYTRPLEWSVNFSQDLPAKNLSLGVDVYGGFIQRSYRFNSIETLKLRTFVRPYAEWKPKAGLSVRVELPMITAPQTRLRDTFEVFPGARGGTARPDISDRAFPSPRGLFFRIRQDFG